MHDELLHKKHRSMKIFTFSIDQVINVKKVYCILSIL